MILLLPLVNKNTIIVVKTKIDPLELDTSPMKKEVRGILIKHMAIRVIHLQIL
jgi:hypothetical protein